MRIAFDIAILFGRRTLCGLSQCAFQTNEITGALFTAAVAVFNWRMAVFYVVSALIATLVARALNGDKGLLELGLYQFNSALLGLALANFFQPSSILWLYMVILAAATAALTVAWSKLTRLPFLAAPFIFVLWAIWPFAEHLSLSKVEFGAFSHAPMQWGVAAISTFGSALFAPSIASGLLFLAGLLVSNWRHAVVATLGALTAIALATQAGAPGTAINSGFVGFNGVLAALAAYILIAADLRLVALAALLSTWLASYVYRGAPVPVLASGFVLAVWLILFLGWANPWFAGKALNSEPDKLG